MGTSTLNSSVLERFLLKEMQPGDILVYSGKSPFSFLIKVKTYSRVTHTAVYVGQGQQREFREFRDSEQVPFRIKNLIAVYRPTAQWNGQKSQDFWDQVCGEKYDYIGLILSFVARRQGRNNKRMFCSEYVIRDQRYSSTGLMLMANHVDADGVAPADIDRSPNKTAIWRDNYELVEDREVGFRVWDPLVEAVVGEQKGQGEPGGEK